MTQDGGQCGTPPGCLWRVHIQQRSNMAISISPHGNDVQGGMIPGRIHEVCSLNFQEHSYECGANAASDVLLEIREIPSETSRTCEHEKKTRGRVPLGRTTRHSESLGMLSRTLASVIRLRGWWSCELGGCAHIPYMVHHSVLKMV